MMAIDDKSHASHCLSKKRYPPYVEKGISLLSLSHLSSSTLSQVMTILKRLHLAAI